MNHGELQTKLGTLLKVKEKRYPLETRTEHLNQAIRDLDDEFESWFAEETTSWATVASTGEYDTDTYFAAPYLEFVSPRDAYYLTDEGVEVPLEQLSLEEIMYRYPADTDDGEPKAFAIWDQSIVLRPTPDSVYTIYWKYMGKKRDMEETGDSNDWTNKEPYAVLYTAAVYACVHLLEETRAKLFMAFAEKKIANISIRQSATMDGRRPVSEEPGYETGT